MSEIENNEFKENELNWFIHIIMDQIYNILLLLSKSVNYYLKTYKKDCLH